MRASHGTSLTIQVSGSPDQQATCHIVCWVYASDVVPTYKEHSYCSCCSASSGMDVCHQSAGILCNPGAAYRDVGVTEAEVATLAGTKEGCDDEVDFIDVQRPNNGTSAGAGPGGAHNGIISDSDILRALKTGAPQLGHPAEVALKWVKKPLGSVRVSLGYMSTFEDVDAFVRFIEQTFSDRDTPEARA
jgi:hypothetical protein